MSIANGAGSRRSKRTRVPLAVVVNCSAPPPPLTSTVSLPSPPSLRSVSSPGFQIIRSLPLWPKAWSSASPPVSVSLSLPPNSRSKPPRPSSVSLPAWPKSWSPPEPPVRVSLPAPPNRFAAGSAPLTSLSVIVSLTAEPEDPDLGRVGDRRRAAGDGDRAAVHEDLPGRIAADRGRVVAAVAEHRQHAAAGAERCGGRRARRRARGGKYTGGEHGGREQPARRAAPADVASGSRRRRDGIASSCSGRGRREVIVAFHDEGHGSETVDRAPLFPARAPSPLSPPLRRDRTRRPRRRP